MSSRAEEFREFAHARVSPLQQSAYLLCGDWHLAQDLVQETLVKAYRHWPRVRRAREPTPTTTRSTSTTPSGSPSRPRSHLAASRSWSTSTVSGWG